jgi:hypothetical protein
MLRLPSLRQAIAAGVLGAAALPVWAAGSTVTTYGEFYRYSGPLGAGIFSDGSQPVADADGKTWFRDVATGYQMPFAPTEPYEGYPWPPFEGAGIGLQQRLLGNLPSGPGGSSQLWLATQGIEFWVDEGVVPDPPNRLRIVGTVTANVTLDPVSGKSNLFKLATFEFTNSTWFATLPTIDPGNGPLYPAADFDFSILAFPNPFIGTSPFPGYHVLNATLRLDTTAGPNSNDYVSLLDAIGQPLVPGVLSVPEGATGTVELWGRIGSLIPEELRNPTGGIQIIDQIPVQPPPIPEPATVMQLLLGLGLLAAARSRLRRR